MRIDRMIRFNSVMHLFQRYPYVVRFVVPTWNTQVSVQSTQLLKHERWKPAQV